MSGTLAVSTYVLARPKSAGYWRVRRAVSALPREQREVVEVRQERGLTFQAIADRLHRPLGTVLTQMRAAIAKIGEALEDYR